MKQDQSSNAALQPKQKITTFLTYNNQAEEAMNFYVSVFKNARVLGTSRYDDSIPHLAGTFMTGTFEIDGQRFMVLNGGPNFTFGMGFSLFVDCETQEEVDELWEKLSEGGRKMDCGWVTDRFGVCWQIIPSVLGKMLTDPDPETARRVMNAMLQMQKIDIAALEQAYHNN